MSSGDRTYMRYVALGDSQTEGLNDRDGTRGYRGWADRLADHLAAAEPRLRYANLAVRGQLTQQIHSEQLPAALRLHPDLATVMAGMNDLLRPNFHAATVADHLEDMYAAFTGIGAHVVTVAFPDPGRLVPAARAISGRTRDLNTRIRAAAARHGVAVVDLTAYPICSDPRLWSADRLHLNTDGHTRLAAAIAHALDLPGSNTTWMDPLAPQPRPAPWHLAWTELRWATDFVGPWLIRRILGRSSGDGRTAKRPDLTPVHSDHIATPATPADGRRG
jgi:lysophospholipase L1-like esterase